MSSDAEKAEKIQKLLRLASPTSGATEAERITAALTAATIFGELDAKKTSRRRPKPEPPPPAEGEYSEPRRKPHVEPWHRSRSTPESTVCQNAHCVRPIGLFENVWRRVNDGKVEWLHDTCPRPGATNF